MALNSPEKSYWLFGSLLALLVMGVATQFLFSLGRLPSPSTLPTGVIPVSVPNVTIKDLDIAGSDSVGKAIEEGLGFSDYRYREYRRGGVQFTVYLAYWQARKRHFMDLGTHAPDNCWVSNGWQMEPKLPKYTFELGPDNSTRKIWPGESRIFQANGETIHVVYWHLLNGQPLEYTRYGTGKTMGYLMDNLGHYWRGTGEQYFLRVSSNRPVGEWQADPTFQALLESLLKHTPLSARQ